MSVRRRGCFCYIALIVGAEPGQVFDTASACRASPLGASPPGSVGYDAEVTAKRRAADLAGAALGRKLAAMRSKGESCLDVIIRLAGLASPN